MAPDFNVVHHAPGMEAQAISNPGKQYAIFLSGNPQEWIKLNLPKGNYWYEFISPFNGRKISSGSFRQSKAGIKELSFPEGTDKLAGLKILKQ